VGKRSPILGYNHNVRYRGLVFHVQSEDSGVSTPHLFTHLFHHGVIVSTRKLVYDAGSAEESIKSLMQAQHKAVLKDLRRGHFDDKIDSYLGGTPGLLPRGVTEDTEAVAVPSELELPPSRGTIEDVAVGVATEQVLPIMFDELSAPVLIIEKTPVPATARAGTPPPIPRLPTSERLSAQLAASRGPALVDVTLKTEAPAFASSFAPGGSASATHNMVASASGELDLSPEIEIQLELDDNDEAISVPRRGTRDTEMNMTFPDETRPTLGFDDYSRPTLGMVNEEAKRAASISDGIPGAIRASSPAILPAPPPPSDSRRLDNRPSTINAATLPPARPIARPPARPALSQPQVVSRPATSDDRNRRESEAVEVYSPAPASAELPPGERPGQYAQHKKVSTRIPIDGLRDAAAGGTGSVPSLSGVPSASSAPGAKEPPKTDRSGGVAIPAGLGRPPRSGTAPSPNKASMATPSAGSPPLPRDAHASGRMAEPPRGRALTPTRIAPVSPSASRAPTGSSGVVMTRPALIVGAPAQAQGSPGTIPRIRKAREDEGRGFGQGLISEKSLDEVILAYLSEDADEK
jgi:hypothetical protein